MEYKIIRLRSDLHAKKELIDENTNFIEEINNELINEDILLKEDAPEGPASIVLIESGGSEGKFLEIFDQLKNNILIINNSKNNSLAASLEIKTYCNTHGKYAFMPVGNETTLASCITKFVRIAGAIEQIKGNKLGVIGTPSDWLISSTISYNIVKEKLHMDMVDIPMEELYKEIDSHQYAKIPHKEELIKKFKNKEKLDEAFLIYSALKRLVKKYDLKGLTIRCFDMLGKYKNTACLALALLNEEGITSACEGDTYSLITMHLVRALTGRSSFQANPSKIDDQEKTVMLAHCTIPLDMLSKYSLTTHFESGLGVAIKGDLQSDDVTLCKLFYDEEEKNFKSSYVAAGKIKENCSIPGYCRTQVVISLDEYDFVNLVADNYGNHLIVSYGDISEDFTFLLMLLDKNKCYNCNK